MDPYKKLNVTKFSSKAEIKKSYHKLSLEHHPDRGGDSDTFKEISEAYSWLSKNHVAQGVDNASKEFLKEVYKSMRKAVPTQMVRIEVPLNKALQGFDKKLLLSLEVPCTDCVAITRSQCDLCGGKGIIREDREDTVTFERVTQQNQLVTLTNYYKGITLIVKIYLTSHKNLKIRGRNIESSESISIFKALAGGEFEVDTAFGKETVELPLGKISNYTYMLKGKGLDGGNHLINFKVFPPKQLTGQQVELFNVMYEEERQIKN